jgi:di/tricarboxylate transporter
MLFTLLPILPALAAAHDRLTPYGWISLSVTFGVFVALFMRRSVPIDALFLAALAIVTLTGVLTPQQAVAGFAEPAVIMIGALFAAAAGLRATGTLDWIGNKLLGNASNEFGALTRLALMIVPVSAFVLNTPLVAMFAPIVVDWCRKNRISPSRLLIPLSYLTILGGVCTLIGTSTTLVCNGQLAREAQTIAEKVEAGEITPKIARQVRELNFFEITKVGVPIALVGGVYMMLIAPRLLPNRVDLIEQLGERRREYLVEMLVQPGCSLIGSTVQQAGLRNLPGLFLIEIDRSGEVITPVTPQDTIQPRDRMIFTGVVTTIADLERIPGLVPAADRAYEFHPAQRTQRQLTEAVLSRTSPLIGHTVREANFRQRYNAAVVAVHRNGERLTNKVGNIRLEPGDTLLLQTRAEFVDAYRHNRDFYLVSRVGGSSARRHDRAILAGALFAGLILWLTISSLFGSEIHWGNLFANKPQAISAIAVVVAMVVTRCLSVAEARSAIDIQVLITIAAAIGIGSALNQSGAASWLANRVVETVGNLGLPAHWEPYLLLAVVYVVAMVFTESITNVAVAAIMIPVAIGVALAGGYDPRPFIIAVTLAASLSFITPIGYQTNLMVMGPGGYQPRDYARVGIPLALLTALIALVLIPLIWPLTS